MMKNANQQTGYSYLPKINRYLLLIIVFYIIFLSSFLLSGLLSLLSLTTGAFPYRMGVVSFLIIPIIFLYKIKNNPVLFAYIFLAFIIFLSGVYNKTSPIQILLFSRTIIFSFLIYFLVETFVRSGNISKIIKLCVWIAVIQLPILLIERAVYKNLPAIIKSNAAAIDFGFGSFNFKGDAPMAIFLSFIVIFLLFDKKRNYIITNKWLILGWLTLTILVANAEIVRIIIAVVWLFYLFSHFNEKVIILGISSIFLIGVVVLSTGWFSKIWDQTVNSLTGNLAVNTNTRDSFLTGGYGRGAAISYYLNREILLLGDGPSKYYDPLSKVRVVGNTGHIFSFYSEIGLIGWLSSIMVFFFIAFPIKDSKIRVRWVSLLIFISIQALSLTTEIMNDISIVLIYCLIAKSYLIPMQSPPDDFESELDNLESGKI